jgi:RnfABCDGE-type electron transport complex B subunit
MRPVRLPGLQTLRRSHSPRAKPTSTSARRAAWKACASWPTCSAAKSSRWRAEEKPKQVAIIDEQTCIGCTLCIQACPVDAIVGAAKQMHTIIAPLCTGCELCLRPARSSASHAADHRELDNWKWKYPVIEIKRARPGGA